jgi:hypothetical protein
LTELEGECLGRGQAPPLPCYLTLELDPEPHPVDGRS